MQADDGGSRVPTINLGPVGATLNPLRLWHTDKKGRPAHECFASIHQKAAHKANRFTPRSPHPVR